MAIFLSLSMMERNTFWNVVDFVNPVSCLAFREQFLYNKNIDLENRH